MKYDGKSDWKLMNATSVRIVLMLFRSRNHIWDYNQKIAQEYGLTWAQFNTLAALRQMPLPYQLSPTELYDATQITSGGLTKVLLGLEEKDLIKRVKNKADRRSRFVELTHDGVTQIEKIVEHLCIITDELFNDAFTTDEQQQFAGLLYKLSSSLDNHKN